MAINGQHKDNYMIWIINYNNFISGYILNLKCNPRILVGIFQKI